MWSREDPRFTIYKLRHIIILRPRIYGPRTCVAQVETKHSYYIDTEFEEPYKHLSADDDWPEGWQWTFMPEEERV